MSDIRLEVDYKSVEERFRGQLPDNVSKGVEDAMRRIVGNLYSKVLENIEAEFAEGGRSKGTLADSILGTVTRQGDLIVGTVGADLTHAPYARILELGGVIPAHRIMPRSASMLKIPMYSMHFEWTTEGYDVVGDYLVSRHHNALVVDDLVLLWGVQHPGGRIGAHFYLNKALIELSKTYENDIELAVAASIVRTGMGAS